VGGFPHRVATLLIAMSTQTPCGVSRNTGFTLRTDPNQNSEEHQTHPDLDRSYPSCAADMRRWVIVLFIPRLHSLLTLLHNPVLTLLYRVTTSGCVDDVLFLQIY
jgi:hypothetical protein